MPTWNYWLLNYISGEIAAHFHLFPVRLSFQARRLPACYLPARIFCLRSLPGWDLFVCMHGFSTPACFVTSKGELWHLPVFRFSDIVKKPQNKTFSSLQGNVTENKLLRTPNRETPEKKCVCAYVYFFSPWAWRTGGERRGVVAMPNDGHYSPLSDAGARSMKLRHFSPERGGGWRGEVERDVKEGKRCGEVKNARWNELGMK